ncbi:MAG: acetolactate synthase small subunit [Thaumarchaeota archaeon]|nr:MAG: acetolactate synthase small subunit [Candidatus Wolframiiraptor sp.]RLG08080.1 MAG: acetolactate synthase small subunit [Nitrososphaerota archaeon]HDD40489.1 acetolactate synthase small subunit [Nitrososphaeria archaeon]
MEAKQVKPPLNVISFIVENKPGVLFKVAWLIRRRAFNIESISVGPAERPGLARMTITVYGDETLVEQVVKQLRKLIDVVKVSKLDPENTVIREMALVKVNVPDQKARADLDYYVRAFRGKIVDVAPDATIVEVTGAPQKVDAFIELMKGFGIKELARTGATALLRSPKGIPGEER